jgi:hypothetical protein
MDPLELAPLQRNVDYGFAPNGQRIEVTHQQSTIKLSIDTGKGSGILRSQTFHHVVAPRG